MAHPRKFRFGAGSMSWDPAEVRDTARRLEDWGYSAFTMGDHFNFPFAPIPLLTLVVEATTTLRVETMLDNNVRHPSVLAKELATLDLISGGRLEIGIGAGSIATEHPRFLGIPAAPLKVRLERLDETLQILEGLWRDETFTFKGKHYAIDGLDGVPKPVQKPRPPFRLGGFGQGIMSLAGRKADIANPILQKPPKLEEVIQASQQGGMDSLLHSKEPAKRRTGEENLVERLGWIRAAAGQRFDDIELQLISWGSFITDNPRAVAEAMIGPMLGSTVEEVLTTPDALIGSVDHVVDLLQERRERFGISYWSIVGGPEQLEAFAPVVARLTGK